jgi:hypothetical protein
MEMQWKQPASAGGSKAWPDGQTAENLAQPLGFE